MPRKRTPRADVVDPGLNARIVAGRLQDLDGVEILCGIPSFNNARTIGNVVRAVEAGLRRVFPDVPAAIVVSDGGSEDGTPQAALDASTGPDEELLMIDPKAPAPARLVLNYEGISGKGSAFRSIFALAARTGVRGCAVFDSDLRSITPGWVENLLKPVLVSGQDFVAPIYARHKYDGTITNAIAFPLSAALYGYRVRQPIGGEFGFSGKLASYWSEQDVWETDVARYGIDIWMTTTAIVQKFRVCQAQLGAKVHDAKDPGAHLGPMFRQVVTTILRLAVANEDRWAKVHGSHDVPAYGFERLVDPPPLEINVLRLLTEFHQGALTLGSTWSEMLAPDTVAEVVALAGEAGTVAEAVQHLVATQAPAAGQPSTAAMAAAAAAFNFPDTLWARVIYDLVITARDQPDRLEAFVTALVPVYFGRVASAVIENRDLSTDRAEDSVERQAREFERLKPYLVNRWSHS